MTLATFLNVAAALCLVLATFNVPGARFFNFLGAGLLCWFLAEKLGDGTFHFGN